MTTETSALPVLLSRYPNLATIVRAVTEPWPEHERFLVTSFSERDEATMALSEEIAGLVLKVMDGDLVRYAAGYQWLCNMFVQEDLFFRRTGHYRQSSFDKAVAEVYARSGYMENYLKGILLTQVLWANQAKSFLFYVDQFLARLPPDANYLEVGPGHGLLLYFAARRLKTGTVTGWDVSQSSLAMTKAMLETMSVERPARLDFIDILKPPSEAPRFDAVVVSEVLEHLERPDEALKTVVKVLKTDGIAFFNVPINSPAPDHIFLWRSPEDFEQMVRDCGLDILQRAAIPNSGYDLERARRRKVTINSLVIATPHRGREQ